MFLLSGLLGMKAYLKVNNQKRILKKYQILAFSLRNILLTIEEIY